MAPAPVSRVRAAVPGSLGPVRSRRDRGISAVLFLPEMAAVLFPCAGAFIRPYVAGGSHGNLPDSNGGVAGSNLRTAGEQCSSPFDAELDAPAHRTGEP